MKAYLAYRERWQPETISAALERGKLFHAVMEAHYRLKIDEGPFIDPWKVISDAPEGDETDTVRWMYEGYLEAYGDDPDWEILQVEQKVEQPLRLPSGRKSAFVLKGFVDLLVRDHSAGGGLYVVDHKTCRELPKQRALDFDDQFGIYVLLLRRQGLDVRGVIYNACRTYKLKRPMDIKERFKRELTVRTDRELEVMAQEALETFQSAYRGTAKGDKEGGQLPPRSPDPDRCGWRCPFTEACLMSRKGRPIRPLLTDMGFQQSFERH